MLKRKSDDGNEPAARLRRRLAAQDLALQAACETVRVKKEMVDDIYEASRQREEQLRAVVLRQLDGAEKVADAVHELMMAIECPVCMEQPATTALSCGHCFCCHQGCESKNVSACPTCRAQVETRTVLFGPVTWLHEIVASRFELEHLFPTADARALVASGSEAGAADSQHQPQQGGAQASVTVEDRQRTAAAEIGPQRCFPRHMHGR